MYSGFELKLNNSILSKLERDINHKAYQPSAIDSVDEFKLKLEDLILNNGNLSAEKMWEQWFPEISCHVFISHSHRNENDAKTFAQWLYQNFGIKSFIDSTVWGYADELLRQIDDDYCLNSWENTYNYNKRNISTAHIHMILMSALVKMMDKTECVIFLNTPESINTKEAITDRHTTYSPWIYGELLFSDLLRKNIPERIKTQIALEKMESVLAEDRKLLVQYPVDLKHLVKLSHEDLDSWKKQSRTSEPLDNLDLLYKIKNVQTTY